MFLGVCRYFLGLLIIVHTKLRSDFLRPTKDAVQNILLLFSLWTFSFPFDLKKREQNNETENMEHVGSERANELMLLPLTILE